MTLRARLSPARLVAAALLASLTLHPSLARTARADEAACFAASEKEITLRKQQKLREAVAELVICAAPACPAEVRTECGRRIVELNAALPTLVLVATDAGGNDVIAVTVTVDGAPFASTLDGRALPIDPGSHVLRFEAPGKAPVEKTIVAREGEKDRHISVVLAAGGAGAGPAVVAPVVVPGVAPGVNGAAAVAPGTPQAGSVAEPTKSTSSWSTQKTFALIAAGVGLVGIGLGTAEGLAASSDFSTQKKLCGSPTSCTDPAGALSAHNSTVTAGTVASAGFVVGAVGVVAGVVLWFTAPHAKEAAPAQATLTAAGVRFEPMVGRETGMMLSGSFQ